MNRWAIRSHYSLWIHSIQSDVVIVFLVVVYVQMEYPRTERIRKRWLLRRICELVVFIGLMLFLVDQYVEPAILNSIAPLRESWSILVVERILKLSLPCMYLWLTIFYTFFHVFLNVVSSHLSLSTCVNLGSNQRSI
jgi:diacylglycerol O-acyltransferase 1